MAARQNSDWLIFVDTNVFLDFYRQPGEYATRQLDTLEKHKNALIICEQVWMEFLKNRQKAILAGIERMTGPKKMHNVPPILLETQAKKMAEKHFGNADNNFKKMEKKIVEILTDPQKYDPVYKSVKRLFKSNTNFNLKRPNKVRFQIREKANKRFRLGYPPRKNSDSSIGDAYNWEWIVHCAMSNEQNYNVLIVSRDGDFGSTYKNKSLINDWLWQEFRDRVGSRFSIKLTAKLSDALRKLDEAVAPEDEKLEEDIISREYSEFQKYAEAQRTSSFADLFSKFEEPSSRSEEVTSLVDLLLRARDESGHYNDED